MNNQRTLVLSETYELSVNFDDTGYTDGRVRLNFEFYVNGVNVELDRYSYLSNERSQIQINDGSVFHEAGSDLPYYKFLWWDKLNWDQKDEVRAFVRGIINKMPHTHYKINEYDIFEEKE